MTSVGCTIPRGEMPPRMFVPEPGKHKVVEVVEVGEAVQAKAVHLDILDILDDLDP